MRHFINRSINLIFGGTLNLATDTIKVMLFAGQKTGDTHANTTVDNIASTTALTVGMRITGTNIPANTTITAKGANSVTLSQAATGTTPGVTLTFHPSQDQDFVGDVSGIEVSGTGYAAGFGGAGRKTLASKTFTEDDTNDRSAFDAADLSWTGLNAGVITGFALIKEITNDAASPIIYYCSDGGFPITSNGGTFDLIWDPTGVAYANNSIL